MKCTATVLAILGTTACLVTAAPLNITSTEMRPHCGEWRSFGCTIDSAYVLISSTPLEIDELMSGLDGLPIGLKATENACGSMVAILMMDTLLALTSIGSCLSDLFVEREEVLAVLRLLDARMVILQRTIVDGGDKGKGPSGISSHSNSFSLQKGTIDLASLFHTVLNTHHCCVAYPYHPDTI
jgi:hypothetical protein